MVVVTGLPARIQTEEDCDLPNASAIAWKASLPAHEAQTLSESLPDAERDWIDEIPAIFGEKWKREGMREGRKEGLAIGIAEGRAKGREEGRQEEKKKQQCDFTIRVLRAFPDWSDEQVAGFVNVAVEFVQKLREELKPEG